MSKLISGEEALIALANGEEVEFKSSAGNWSALTIGDLLMDIPVRLKPKTITINGIEVPAPFKPNEAGTAWFIDDDSDTGYWNTEHYSSDLFSSLGWWRTEEEIKQVVDALRKVFNP